MNTVTASFDTTVRQMTEMSQQKMTEISQRKKKTVADGFNCSLLWLSIER